MNDLQQPLVSIIVITYNSAKYVLETLESAKDQSYQNIELIITDDCSTDQTVEICNSWIKENSQRFINVKLIITDKNTGISANCNRGLFSANGEWLKLIAGDDVLMKNCINDNILFVENNSPINIVFSKVNEIGEIKNHYFNENMNNMKHCLGKNARSQYNDLIRHNFLLAPTSFINKNFLIEFGGYNEMYRNMEDYPLWVKLSQKGIKLYYFDKTTVLYRSHENCMSSRVKEDYILFLKNTIQIELFKKFYLVYYIENWISIILFKNQNSRYILILNMLKFLSPIKYFHYFKRTQLSK